MKYTFGGYIEFILPFFILFGIIWIILTVWYKKQHNQKYKFLNFLDKKSFEKKYGIDIYTDEQKQKEIISGFKKNVKIFKTEIEKISEILLEKKDSFKLNPAQAALFVELFSGKILKSDKGKYYVISDLDLENFIHKLKNNTITEKDINNAIEKIIKKIIPTDKPEIEAVHLFYMLKTNQIPDFTKKEIFEFSHIDSLEENVITSFYVKDDNWVNKHTKKMKEQVRKIKEKTIDLPKDNLLETHIGDKKIVFDISNGINGMYIEKDDKEKQNNKENKQNRKDEVIVETLNSIQHFIMEQEKRNQNIEELIEILIKNKTKDEVEEICSIVESKKEEPISKEEKEIFKQVSNELQKSIDKIQNLTGNTIPDEIYSIKTETNSNKTNASNSKKKTEKKIKEEENKNEVMDITFSDEFGLDSFDIIENKQTTISNKEDNTINKDNEIKELFFGEINRLIRDTNLFKDNYKKYLTLFLDISQCFLQEKKLIFKSNIDNNEYLFFNRELMLFIYLYAYFNFYKVNLLNGNLEYFLKFYSELLEKYSQETNKMIFNNIRILEKIYNTQKIFFNKKTNFYKLDKNNSYGYLIIRTNILDILEASELNVISSDENIKKTTNEIILFVKEQRNECGFEK